MSDRALCRVDDVLAIFHDTAQDRATEEAIDIAGTLDTGRLRFDSLNAQSCLDAVRDAPCDDRIAKTRRQAACAAVVIPNTPTDRSCWSDLECTGGVCFRAPGCSGFCGPYASFGVACVDDPAAPLSGRCDPTVGFCGSLDSGATPTCQRRKKDGEACAETRQCVSGRVCRGLVCVLPVEIDEGQPCGGETPCHDSSYCDPSTLLCARQHARAQVCNASRACKDGLGCLGLVEVVPKDGMPVAVQTTGVCGDWLDLGAPCTDVEDGITGCPASQRCVGRVCTQTSSTSGYRDSCASRACGEGLGCDARQLCDYKLALFGDCGGDRALLCASSVVCNPTGPTGSRDAFDKPGTCQPPSPPACFSPPASS